MNTTRAAQGNHHSSSPKNEIKAAPLGESGRTIKTRSTSEMSFNDNDSVVSEITLDPAFRQAKSEPFTKTVIVRQSPNHERSPTRQLPQKTVSKLDGNDFLDGKFKSAFHKEVSEVLIQQGQETSLKQTLLEKKLATEYANFKKDTSNAKLDDLPENSLMEMFTSVNLDVEVPDSVKQEEERQRRRRSSEIKKRREKDSHYSSREITLDPKVVQGKKQRRRRSKKASHDDSRDIVFDPTESTNVNESSTSTFIPPLSPAQLEDAANGNQDQRPDSNLYESEITVLPEELMDIVEEPQENPATPERQEKQPRRSSNHKRRSSKAPKKVPVRRLPFEDVPLSITIDDDNTLVSGMYCPELAHIDEEEQEQTQPETKEENEKSHRRRHSTSSARPSRKADHIESPKRARRHSTEKSSRQRSPRRNSHHAESPGRRRHSTSGREGSKPRSSSKHRSASRNRPHSASHNDNKKQASHHSKGRPSHHERKPSKDESASHPPLIKNEDIEDARTDTIDETSGGNEGIKITIVQEAPGKDPMCIDKKSDPIAKDSKKDRKPSEEMVEVLREPVKMRRTFSAPELASPTLISERTEDEEATSPLSEAQQKRFTPTSATMTPKSKNLWKRIRQRSMRPISSLSNERSDTSLRSLQNPQSPSKQSLTDSGSFSKRSMSSSGSSDLGSSKGSERSLTSPPPIKLQPTGSQVIAPKARKQYTPTVVHDSTLSMSYSELVMQGKIGMPGMPIPEEKEI